MIAGHDPARWLQHRRRAQNDRNRRLHSSQDHVSMAVFDPSVPWTPSWPPARQPTAEKGPGGQYTLLLADHGRHGPLGAGIVRAMGTPAQLRTTTTPWPARRQLAALGRGAAARLGITPHPLGRREAGALEYWKLVVESARRLSHSGRG